jgi:hypothetical protein
MTMVTKSGTNDFHGSLFGYHRNSALDARNFFDRKVPGVQERRLPAFVRNNFGGAVGGPIQQDKLFFHVVYEGVRERLGITNLINVIPASAKVDGGAGGVAQIAPIIKPWLDLFPNPNLPNNQYTFSSTRAAREDFAQARVDYTLSPNSTLFARHTIHDSNRTLPLTYPQFQDFEISRNQFLGVSENHIFSPALLGTFRFAYIRSRLAAVPNGGINGPQFSMVAGRDIGSIGIGGISGGFGGTSFNPQVADQDTYSGAADLFYSLGVHSLKFGVSVTHEKPYMVVSTATRGAISFTSLTSFLLGQPDSYNATKPGSVPERTYQYQTFGFYVQDDMRLTRSFTLNLGLRYEFNTTMTEVSGLGSYIRDVQRDAVPTVDPQVIRNPSLKNFSPRLGFAWDVRGDEKTAVRGGFGLLYDVNQIASGLIITPTAMPPFSGQSSVINPGSFTLPFFFPPESVGKRIRGVDYLMQQPHMLQYNLTIERELPWNTGLNLGYVGSRGINIPTWTEGNPTVWGGIPEGRNCVPRPANVPLVLNGPKCWLGNELRTNPNWDDFNFVTARSNTWYNSFQVTLMKRLGHGLQFQNGYTWSKTLDENQSLLSTENSATGSISVDPSNRRLDKGRAAFDVRHNWRFNAIYRPPDLISQGGGASAKLLNGWWISGIIKGNTGYPFSPSLSANRSRSRTGGAGSDFPNLAPGRTFEDIILGGPDRYFDPTGFEIQPAGFLGTAGRNILDGPGVFSVDFTLAKDTPVRYLGEEGRLEFRAEFFNILNRVNFGSPSRAVYAGTADVQAPLATAGRITNTRGTSRQVQLALKLLF